MATLTIRNLPDEVHAALKARAERSRRSLNQQVIAELLEADAVESDRNWRVRVEREVLDSAALRSRATGFLSAAEIDAAKQGGRE